MVDEWLISDVRARGEILSGAGIWITRRRGDAEMVCPRHSRLARPQLAPADCRVGGLQPGAASLRVSASPREANFLSWPRASQSVEYPLDFKPIGRQGLRWLGQGGITDRQIPAGDSQMGIYGRLVCEQRAGFVGREEGLGDLLREA